MRDLEILNNGALPEKIFVLLERAGYSGINIRSLACRLGVNVKKVREALEKLFSSHQAILLSSDDTTALSVHLYAHLEEALMKSLADYHKKNPLREGISKEELKAVLPLAVSAKLFNMLLASLGKKEVIVSDKDSVRLSSHVVHLAGEEDALRQSIASTYAQAGLTPPALSDVISSFKDQKAKAQTIVKLMFKDGELIKINEDLCFAHEALAKLREDYKAQLIRDGKATPATFKDLTGLSRKYIIPLMEYFDTSKLTVRVEDHRILREKP